MTHINQALPDTLVVMYFPAGYKFTRVLWRVEMISESCPIKPNKKRLSSSTSSFVAIDETVLGKCLHRHHLILAGGDHELGELGKGGFRHVGYVYFFFSAGGVTEHDQRVDFSKFLFRLEFCGFFL